MPFLQFKGKTAIESYHHSVPHHTLEFDGKLSMLRKGEKPGLDGNLIIEGDNLLALKALLPTHAGRIKCIYIDPPYNTGNEGWVYNDNLTQPQFKEWIGQVVGKEGEDATRHDKWCCMMYPRLQLLKEFLRDDGAIFVSIDDNEVHHLRMLMDEVFGEENLVREIVWKNKYGPGAMTKGFGSVHEYILCYGRNPLKSIESILTAEEIAQYTGRDEKFETRGGFVTQPLMTRSKDERLNLIYAVKYKGEEILTFPPKTTPLARKLRCAVMGRREEAHDAETAYGGADHHGVERRPSGHQCPGAVPKARHFGRDVL